MSFQFIQPFFTLGSGTQTMQGSSGWDYDHNFATDDGNWAFATTSATNEVDTSAQELQFDMQGQNDGGTNYAIAGDVMGTTVDNTAWVLDLVGLNFSAITSPAYNFFGMSDSNQTINSHRKTSAGVNEDCLDWSSYNNASPHTNYAEERDGENFDTGTRGTSSGNTWSTSTNYYHRQIRNSATSYTVQMGTNSDFSSPDIDITNTVSSTVQSLRYVKIENFIYTGFGGDWTGHIDQVRFADGVTTPP
jgi:hypothetical protein